LSRRRRGRELHFKSRRRAIEVASSSSSSRRRDFHLFRAIALIFIAPSRFSSSSSHRADLHRVVLIFISSLRTYAHF
jgi:hypothetical protein